ncbi:MAG TPA: SDR family oxidoreductase [Rhizomicrobium sp.]|nr:SDR family oxidoreductase [Rhizomicrobium sp.]
MRETPAPLNLQDTPTLVTGGGSGIGRSFALAAAKRGAHVAVADIEQAAAEAVVQEIAALGGNASAFVVDVVDVGAVDAMVAHVVERFGGLNLLFNNAGVFAYGDLEHTSHANFSWVFNVNVIGAFNVLKAAMPHINKAAEKGQFAHVVHTGSENSICVPGMGPFSAYTASKHAVLGIADCLRRDVEGRGIGVSIVCPGPVRSQLWNAVRTRQSQFGGMRQAPKASSEVSQTAQDPDDVANLTFEGMAAGDFMIITDPAIKPFADRRIADVTAGFDSLSKRI